MQCQAFRYEWNEDVHRLVGDGDIGLATFCLFHFLYTFDASPESLPLTTVLDSLHCRFRCDGRGVHESSLFSEALGKAINDSALPWFGVWHAFAVVLWLVEPFWCSTEKGVHSLGWELQEMMTASKQR